MLAIAREGRRGVDVANAYISEEEVLMRIQVAILFSLLIVLALISPLRAQTAITLSPSTSPGVGQAGVTLINLTASHFTNDSILPGNVILTLRPATTGAGPTSTIPATTISALIGSTKRITFQIPGTLLVSAPTAYLVSVAGTTTGGTAFSSTNTASLTINPPAALTKLSPSIAPVGQTLSVTISGRFTNFVQNATKASFGAGIAVGGGSPGDFGPVTVTSPTSATAQIVIDAQATVGLRAVIIKTGSQQAVLPAAFSLTAKLPPDPATIAPPLSQVTATPLSKATEFLYTGPNPIQTGVAPGTIEPRRAAVLRGKVLDNTGAALSGVAVTISNHPELGQTLSRGDGMFDLAVNGGGQLTVIYQKVGYPTAHRQITTPWQDFALLPDVMLIPYDPNANPVDLSTTCDANMLCTSPPMQVARGSRLTDQDGTRQATLLIPRGTTVTMTRADGSAVSLTNFHVRLTEYTVGPDGIKAMPADLPPTSGYTYEVEYSVDEAEEAGATRVSFSQPIFSYTENFLGFPVGSIVPSGDYDRKQEAWIPSDNGLVIKILSITNGRAVLDLDGSGKPAGATALTALQIGAEELEKLASLYSAGQTLWRVPIDHFLSMK